MEKLMFLLTSEHFNDIFMGLGYKADNFGPYSDKLADQLENLVDLKLIERKNGDSNDIADELIDNNYYYQKNITKYKLNKYGEVVAKKIFNELTDQDKKNIIGIKNKFNSIPLDSLLGFVYNNIPKEYLLNSKIKDKYCKS